MPRRVLSYRARTQVTPAPNLKSRQLKTPAVIIEIAEALWGARGVEAVSLREISLASGQSNPAAVQYHFGGKEELLWAVFRDRLPVIDEHRAAMLEALQSQGRLREVRGLLECMFRPLFEQRNLSGRRSYAPLLFQVLGSQPALLVRNKAMELTPATQKILDLLYAHFPQMSRELQRHRMITLNLFVLSTIIRLDIDAPEVHAPEELFDDALSMAAAAFCQPPLR